MPGYQALMFPFIHHGEMTVTRQELFHAPGIWLSTSQSRSLSTGTLQHIKVDGKVQSCLLQKKTGQVSQPYLPGGSNLLWGLVKAFQKRSQGGDVWSCQNNHSKVFLQDCRNLIFLASAPLCVFFSRKMLFHICLLFQLCK